MKTRLPSSRDLELWLRDRAPLLATLLILAIAIAVLIAVSLLRPQ